MKRTTNKSQNSRTCFATSYSLFFIWESTEYCTKGLTQVEKPGMVCQLIFRTKN